MTDGRQQWAFDAGTRDCKVCGAPFLLRGKRPDAKFCSHSCSNKGRERKPKPCRRGHSSPRDARGNCIECKKFSDRRWSVENKERVSSYAAAIYQANRDDRKAARMERYQRDPRRALDVNRQSRFRHIEKIRAYDRDRYLLNPEIKKAEGAAHRPHHAAGAWWL
jgi:hypothetical protein